MEQFTDYLKFPNTPTICYHFLRMFRHLKDGPKNWILQFRNELVQQIGDVSKCHKTVVLFFYIQPLCSVHFSSTATLEFQPVSAHELLKSGVAIFITNDPRKKV